MPSRMSRRRKPPYDSLVFHVRRLWRRSAWKAAAAVGGAAVFAALLIGAFVSQLPDAPLQPLTSGNAEGVPAPAAPAASREVGDATGASPAAAATPLRSARLTEPAAIGGYPTAATAPAPADAQAPAETPQSDEDTALDAGLDTGPDAAAPQAEPDEMGTASITIVRPDLGGNVDVAETEAEIARLEEATGMVPKVAENAGERMPALASARTTAWVNLRSGPADEAEVLSVVPGNAGIEAETDCEWCTVVYDGKRGYIYKSFISRGTGPAAGLY